ncbi:hypothetical protein, partial [Rhodobacter sp. SGA-6-6]|uniref:hypothetical protein n=1 Tax=Rhodobacter sp. SGA-6-6 TaxID=2710882 RepID=UPI0019810BC5
VKTQFAHQVIAAARQTAERKMSARLSYLVAMRRKPLRMLPHVGAFTRGIASVLVDAHLAM